VLADYLLKKTVGQTYIAEDQFDFSVILPNNQLEHFNIVSLNVVGKSFRFCNRVYLK